MTTAAELASAQRLDAVPDYTHFPTVDELTASLRGLADAHPEVATLQRIGTSRLGEPLLCLDIAGGAQHAVVFASVHPNEPIGNLTALHLAETLCRDTDLREQLGYTWHIIACIDPDGTRLNEGWFAGPFDRGHYGRHFYRPAGHEQVEWTFPFAYKDAYFDAMLPETVALMRLIDRTRPAFMCSLHNGEMGGVYYYLSRPTPELYPILTELPGRLGLPLDTGEPEAPYVEQFAPAIFGMISPARHYDFVVGLGQDPLGSTSGDSSSSYASKYGTLSLVTEVPYWSHPDADDPTPTDLSYGTVVHRRGEGLRELSDRLVRTLAAVEPHARAPESPFFRATRAFAPSIGRTAAQDIARAARADADRPATVAERFSCADIVHCFRLRYGGILLRALDGELAIGHGTPTIRAEHAALSEAYDGWIAEAADDRASVIPIGKLVAVQYGAILAAAVAARTA